MTDLLSSGYFIKVAFNGVNAVKFATTISAVVFGF